MPQDEAGEMSTVSLPDGSVVTTLSNAAHPGIRPVREASRQLHGGRMDVPAALLTDAGVVKLADARDSKPYGRDRDKPSRSSDCRFYWTNRYFDDYERCDNLR